MSITQTFTPHHVLPSVDKDILAKEFVGRSLNELRTPALVIDRAIFASNCAKMHDNARKWGASFRAHLKTHKTAEGTRLQLLSDVDKTSAVVVSTLMEAWQIVNAGLVSDGTVNDILYGLPVAINKIADLARLWQEISADGCTIRLLVDNLAQVKALEDSQKLLPQGRLWSAFVKCDGGQNRAGLKPGSPAFAELVKALSASPAVNIYGFYAHAGNSYASTSLDEASSFLSAEVQVVNHAAELAKQLVSSDRDRLPFVLSVGSTPTAHTASAETRGRLRELLHGTLELHAGNYPLLDLQQLHTTLVDSTQIAQKVLSTVISYYPGRGQNGSDEAMCDAGGIAMSKDTGPSGGFGDVIGKAWRLDRISQEHGILTRTQNGDNATLEVGSILEIVGQHACLIAAAHPWYYIIDSSIAGNSRVVDVWVPWKGW